MRCCNCCDNNKEVKAWSFDSINQGIYIISITFYASAIVGLAEQKAGCIENEPCDKTIYGFLTPGSILPFITAIAGFVSSIFMPLVGAIVDHTPYRRGASFLTAAVTVLLVFLKIIIGESTLLFCIILMALAPVIYLIHNTCVYAYLQELTDDEKKLGQYMGFFLALRAVSMLVFMGFVLAVASVLPNLGETGSLKRDVNVAKLSQLMIGTVMTLCYIPCYYNGFGPRPALSRLPPNSSLFGAGCRKVIRTTRDIIKNCRAIKWFLISNALYGSVISSSGSIAVSYMVDFLNMDSSETGIAMILLVLGMIAGSISYRMLVSRIPNNLIALMVFVFFLSSVIFVVAIIIQDVQDKRRIYFIIPLWAYCMGFITPCSRTVYISIIPKGQETELMGIFLFFTNGFLWVPPLIVTILLSNGVSWRWTISTLGFFCISSIISLLLMGTYTNAKQYAIDLNKQRNVSGPDSSINTIGTTSFPQDQDVEPGH